MADTPLGVLILGILNFLVGIILLLGSLAIFGWLGPILIPGWLASITGLILVVGLFYIILGWGLITLKNWAWWIDIIFAILNLIMSLISFPSVSWFNLIINLIIVLYLNQSSIKRKFKV